MPKTDDEIAAEKAAADKAAAEKKSSETDDVDTLRTKLAAATADAEKWQALSKKNETRAKDNADKAEKFDALEESNKTELQKLTDRLAAAEKVNTDREAKEQAKNLATEVAAAKSSEGRVIPASALRGSTKEELEAHADELLALIPEKPGAPSAEGQGKSGENISEGDMSADDIVAAATSR